MCCVVFSGIAMKASRVDLEAGICKPLVNETTVSNCSKNGWLNCILVTKVRIGKRDCGAGS